MKVEARRLKGFQDYLPAVMAKRQGIMAIFRKQAQLAGFQEIGTPALEYADVLLGVGGETDKQVFRFQDNGGRDVVMRYDLTVPFARFVSEHFGELSFPFKRMQIGDVWRAEKPQRGRYREFAQCDLDIIGSDSTIADAEVLEVFANTLRHLNVGPFEMRVGHRGLLSAYISHYLQPSDSSQESEILIALDKWEKIGPAAVKELLQTKLSVAENQLDAFLEVFAQTYVLPRDAERLAKFAPATAQSAVADLVQLFTVLKNLPQIVFDLKTVRGLGYYTGVVFETVLTDNPSIGSICSGGRYDQLATRFSDRDLRGVGGSLGLDRLVAALMVSDDENYTTAQVFVAPLNAACHSYALRVVRSLRDGGIATDISLKEQKFAQQLKQASKRNHPWAILIGEEELASQHLTIKNMLDGTQTSLAFGELQEWARKL